MERLTSRTPAGVANLDYPQNCFYPDGTKDQVAVSAYGQKAIDRLAAYEDTGLMPEEIKERLQAGEALFFERSDLYAELGPIEHLRALAQAEKDGRLAILEPSAKEGGKRPPCFYNDMGQTCVLDLDGEWRTMSLLTGARSAGIAKQTALSVKKPRRQTMSIYAKTKMEAMPGSCTECKYGDRYGCVGDVKCRILQKYFTGNIEPPYKERPDECPLVEQLEPTNDPLTIEELREIDGEPVWIEWIGSDSPEDKEWALVFVKGGICRTSDCSFSIFELYGKTWLAYRRKPEKGENNGN